MLIAAIPVVLLVFVYSSSKVFLNNPFLVINTTYFLLFFLSRDVIATTFSFGSRLIKVPILTPFDALVPAGILSTNNLYIFPASVNTNNVSIVFVAIVSNTASFSDLTPFPPFLCVLNEVFAILLISPVLDNITTTSSGVIASISFSSGLISI